MPKYKITLFKSKINSKIANDKGMSLRTITTPSVVPEFRQKTIKVSKV